MARVEIHNIYKSFDRGKPVLEGISFTVEDGELVTLLGPSGCGKTTLLRIIAGLETADAGELRIGGVDVSRVPPRDRDIAMVFQSYALYPHLRVRENIAMALRLRKRPRAEIERRVGDAAKMLGLEELLDRRPAALSGGQRQRVALARALVRRPEVCLLDEPLSNLDAVLRERTRGEIKLLFRRLQGTAIYVTHDQVEAMTLSDRIVLLHEGRIQQIGAPHEIYHRPKNTFVASFVGSPPMNVFPLAAAERVKALAPAPGRDASKMLCGVRPEEIELAAGDEPGFHCGRVTLVEPTGAHTVLTVEIGSLPLRVAWSGTLDTTAEKLWLRLPPERLHLFDEATGERVPGAGGGDLGCEASSPGCP